MSASTTGSGAADDLQFDRAVDSSAASGELTCAKCNGAIRMYYYHVNGETACSTCKQASERGSGGRSGSGTGGMLKAVLFGLGAALVGALIYYAVMEYLNLEIGYVAILIGFMVGYSIRNAAAGFGARRFQLLGVGLTYLAVALAYSPFAFRDFRDTDEAPTVTAPADSQLIEPGFSATGAVLPDTFGVLDFAQGAAAALIFILVLPVLVILGSMPSGLISALIIVIGMRQAWTMTGAEEVTIAGPFKLGSEPPPATA